MTTILTPSCCYPPIYLERSHRSCCNRSAAQCCGYVHSGVSCYGAGRLKEQGDKDGTVTDDDEDEEKSKRDRQTRKRKQEDVAERRARGGPLCCPPPLASTHTLVLPSHPTSPLLRVAHEEGEVGGIDLAQSKCCQEDWMILLRQGVL